MERKFPKSSTTLSRSKISNTSSFSMRVTPVILPLSKAPDPVEKVAGSISFQFILRIFLLREL